MPVNSKLLEVLPDGYGAVILVGVASNFLNMYLARNVMKARKEFSVEYPDMYSKDNNKFNCIQRAHQSALESHPTFMFLLLVGGLQFPVISAGAGSFYILGRMLSARGYSSGDPSKRIIRLGGFPIPIYPLALLTLLGNTICFACHKLRLN